PDTPRLRTRLADWLTDPAHPLTARVMVNRIWQYHFGTGIVATPNDFGVNGSLPSHPELLDYLANDLIAHGWQLKPLHRPILISRTYRQASANAERETRNAHQAPHSELRIPRLKDPQNRLLWAFPRRRLSAEEIRDSMLAIADRLNAKAGGPSVVLPVES